MIRGKKPQAYDSYSKKVDSLLIPAESIDFQDHKDLETKTAEILEDIKNLKTLGDIINKSLPVPQQLGTLVYNGELQTPVFDVRSSRILISGDTVKKEAGTYTAVATILNGTWENPELDINQPVVWSIEQKKIPKPFVTGLYFVDGSIKSVQLCNYNSAYCEITGKTEERSAGTYEINVRITDPNVMWEDGTSGTVNLAWQIIEITGGSESSSSVPVTVMAELRKLQNDIATLQKNVESNRADINTLLGTDGTTETYSTIIDSLRRRIEILESFLTGTDTGALSVTELIALITKQIEQLEATAKDLSYEDLRQEINSLIKLIENTLEKAEDPADIETLNSLKVRAQDIFKVKDAEEQLKNFKDNLKDKEEQIKELLTDSEDPSAIDSAKSILETIKDEFNSLLESLDDDTRTKVTATTDELRKIILDIETAIVQKEVQQLLNIIEQKLEELQEKLSDGEDTASLISDIRSLLDTAREKAEPYALPFEKDKITTFENLFNKLQSYHDTLQLISEVKNTLDDLKDNMSSYSETKVASDISRVEEQLRQIKEVTAFLGSDTLTTKVTTLEGELDDVKDLFWKKQAERQLSDIAEQLNSIKDSIDSSTYTVDDLSSWHDMVFILEHDLNEIKDTATEKDITLDNLTSVHLLLNTVKDMVVTAVIDITLDNINTTLDLIEESMNSGTATYDEVEGSLDIIAERLDLLETPDLPSSAIDHIQIVRERVKALQQLNEDMKIYLIVKPMLNKIKIRIYDEDLDILWSELNVAEELVNSAHSSSRITELQDEIEEIKTILNSFGKNNTLENLLVRLSSTANIIITTDTFELTGTTYDSAKDNLVKLDQLSVSTDDDVMLTFPSWYSLSNGEKSYLFENNLRKLRRKALTIEDTFSA